MGFWKEEKMPASDWGCLPKDGFLTWALRRCRTDVGLPSSISGGHGTLQRQAQLGYGEEWKKEIRVKFWYLFAIVHSAEL